MARSSSTSSRRPDITDAHNERLEPRLLRAAEGEDVELLQKIIDEAKANGQLNENFLRIALMRSSEKGKIATTKHLLDQGAVPNSATANRLSPLLRAVERDQVGIVRLLLEHGVDPDVPDKKGRTALMTAAWKNYWHTLSLLIARGANVNAKDLRKRNVLHNLAADKKCDWGDSIIELLLKQNIHIDGPEGQDELRRSPLHWACVTGKGRLVELLLTRPKRPKANVNAVEIREKSCLHFAATHARDDIVEILLKYKADVHAKSDGGWTPLHNASEIGSERIVRILLKAGADVNAKLLNGMSPLHLAAQGGHVEVVQCLLERSDIKRAARDTFGVTPFLRAALKGKKDIVNLLAPFNQLDSLSEDALGACNGFNATIVDFGEFRNDNQVKKRTVYELLYGRDPVNPRKPAITILPKDTKATDFRWIHLPANNMAWVEAILTKMFIEEGASDVEGFRALEKSFSHQHRGQQSHSHFMRPICQSTPRKMAEREALESPMEPPTPTIVINNEPLSKDEGSLKTPVKNPIEGLVKGTPSGDERSDWSRSPPNQSVRDHAKGTQKVKGKKTATTASRNPKGGTESQNRDQSRKLSHTFNSRQRSSPSSPARKDPAQIANGNIFTFMPYLHFETDRRRQEMQEAIKRAESMQANFRPILTKASTYDEMLIRAHLATSTVSLHVRRTLDQSFYHNIDTQSRDQDQVVYRYQLKGRDVEEVDPKILMVDQLWMWILGKDLIVTSFPQRWQQPKNDPLNVLDSVIEDINSKTRGKVNDVYDLAMIITGRCSGVFDRHRIGEEEYQPLDMFESSIGNATDRETILFKEFNAASAQASAWLQHRQNDRLSKYLKKTLEQDAKGGAGLGEEERTKFEDSMRRRLFVDKLLDIGQETDLLAETKDIRDELRMIAKVLDDQLQVLPDLQAAICDIYHGEQRSQHEVKKRFKEQTKTIDIHIKDIERMDKQAEHIYSSITDMLDLKQKHANAFEARFARDQAAGTARQSQTIMIFTIVTIIFLPLSFIAAFFTINISEFPHEDGNVSLPLNYVSKYMFGIGFAISIPLIVVALSLENIANYFKGAQRRLAGGKEPSDFGSDDDTLEMLRLEQALSVARSARKSVETDRRSRRLSGVPVSPVTVRERVTGFRIRGSLDVERGFYA